MQEMAVLEGPDFKVFQGIIPLDSRSGSCLLALCPLFTNFLDLPLVISIFLPQTGSLVVMRHVLGGPLTLVQKLLFGFAVVGVPYLRERSTDIRSVTDRFADLSFVSCTTF